MSRRIKGISLIVAAAMLCAGCSSKSDSNKSEAQVQVEKNGKLLVRYEETLDKDYYDSKELEQVIDDEVAEFNDTYGKDKLIKDSFKVKKDVATLWYEFDSYNTYLDYVSNYIRPKKKDDMFIGTYSDAVKSGIKFDGKFERTGETGTISGDKLEDTDNLMVLFTNQEMSVYVPGDVVYYNSEVTIEKDIANTTEAKANYILYKAED